MRPENRAWWQWKKASISLLCQLKHLIATGEESKLGNQSVFNIFFVDMKAATEGVVSHDYRRIRVSPWCSLIRIKRLGAKTMSLVKTLIVWLLGKGVQRVLFFFLTAAHLNMPAF